MADTWHVEPLPIHGSKITDIAGREIVCDVYDEQIAVQIVTEHNAVAFAIQNGENWTLEDWQNWRKKLS